MSNPDKHLLPHGAAVNPSIGLLRFKGTEKEVGLQQQHVLGS